MVTNAAKAAIRRALVKPPDSDGYKRLRCEICHQEFWWHKSKGYAACYHKLSGLIVKSDHVNCQIEANERAAIKK